MAFLKNASGPKKPPLLKIKEDKTTKKDKPVPEPVPAPVKERPPVKPTATELGGLDFKWDGTKLGIKKEGDEEYQFVELGASETPTAFGSSRTFRLTSTDIGSSLISKSRVGATSLKSLVAGSNITLLDEEGAITISSTGGGGGGSSTWGSITGTLSSQTDLQNALNAKANLTGATFTGAISATNLSGTNTGDQNLFSTIAVSGQSNVVADSTSDTLTLVAGTNITITTDASTDSITINASGGGMAIGDSITSATAGSVLFAGTSGVLQQDNANFFWDDSANGLGIGTNSVNAAAALHINSTTKGVLGPRMTQGQMTSISSPPVGLEVYVTNSNTKYIYTAVGPISGWQAQVDSYFARTFFDPAFMDFREAETNGSNYIRISAPANVGTSNFTLTLPSKNGTVAVETRVVTLTDAATVTPNCDTTDLGTLATLSQNTTLANPTGTAVNGQRLMLRVTSSTSRTWTYGSQYRGSVDIPLPGATSGGGLTDYMMFIRNSASSTWDLVAKNFGF